MCKSQTEGGQRCAAHTRPAYESARAAGDNWDEQAAAFASTPTGKDVIEREILAAVRVADYTLAGRLDSALRIGQSMRETNRATQVAMRLAQNPQTARHLQGGYCDLGEEADLASASAILVTLRTLEASRGSGHDINKRQREAISKEWQYPRIPQAGFTDGMPHGVLWSTEALKSYATWPPKSKSQHSRGAKKKPPKAVTLDHLVPQAQLLEQIRPNLDEHDAHSLADLLREHHRTALLCVITYGENDDINDNGWQSENPFPNDPLERYRRSGIVVDRTGFPKGTPRCICHTTTAD